MKKLLLSALLLFSVMAIQVQAAFLEGNTAIKLNNNIGVVQQQAGYDPNLKLGDVVAIAIRGFLGLLGVIFVILIIIAGYNWMTAAGDEEKIKKAGQTIRSAIIGLLIIVAAYAITYFVFRNLPGAGSGSNPSVF